MLRAFGSILMATRLFWRLSVAASEFLLDDPAERFEKLELECFLWRKELGFDDLSVVDLDVRPVGDVELEDLDVLAFALPVVLRSEEHTSELQSLRHHV